MYIHVHVRNHVQLKLHSTKISFDQNLTYVYTCIDPFIYTFVTGSGKIQHFVYFIKIEILLHVRVYFYNVYSIYNVKFAKYEHVQFYHQ